MEGFVALVIVIAVFFIFSRSTRRVAASPKPKTVANTSIGSSPALGGSVKPKYPILTTEMVDSAEKPVTSAMAVRLYKEYMLKVGYLDKQELKDHGEYFAQDLRDHGKYLAEDVRYEIQNFAPLLSEFNHGLSVMKKKLKMAKSDAEKLDLQTDISDAEAEIASYRDDIERAQDVLKAFRSDKREFLIDYVNRQVQGR